MNRDLSLKMAKHDLASLNLFSSFSPSSIPFRRDKLVSYDLVTQSSNEYLLFLLSSSETLTVMSLKIDPSEAHFKIIMQH